MLTLGDNSTTRKCCQGLGIILKREDIETNERSRHDSIRLPKLNESNFNTWKPLLDVALIAKEHGLLCIDRVMGDHSKCQQKI